MLKGTDYISECGSGFLNFSIDKSETLSFAMSMFRIKDAFCTMTGREQYGTTTFDNR